MLSKIHCFLFGQDARVWALMHGSLLDGTGLVLTKADQLTAIGASAPLEDLLKIFTFN